MKLRVSAKYFNKHFADLDSKQSDQLLELIAMEEITMEITPLGL